jgi:hypothetical protein
MKAQRPDSEVVTAHPIAAGGGVQLRPPVGRDPYAELDDLMVVVEELCRQWPTRALFDHSKVWVL